MKSIIGLAIGFAIGGACRVFGVPLPAPPVLIGACLVVAMTAGYSLTDRYLVEKESTTKNSVEDRLAPQRAEHDQ